MAAQKPREQRSVPLVEPQMPQIVAATIGVINLYHFLEWMPACFIAREHAQPELLALSSCPGWLLLGLQGPDPVCLGNGSSWWMWDLAPEAPGAPACVLLFSEMRHKNPQQGWPRCMYCAAVPLFGVHLPKWILTYRWEEEIPHPCPSSEWNSASGEMPVFPHLQLSCRFEPWSPRTSRDPTLQDNGDTCITQCRRWAVLGHANTADAATEMMPCFSPRCSSQMPPPTCLLWAEDPCKIYTTGKQSPKVYNGGVSKIHSQDRSLVNSWWALW